MADSKCRRCPRSNPRRTMSHFTTIKTQIKDIEALRQACAELGLALEQNAQARGYASNQIKGDYVIRLKGPYDIALNRQPEGSYSLTDDQWGNYVEDEVGPQHGKLMQLYAVHKALREARKKGHLARRSRLPDGSIQLTIG